MYKRYHIATKAAPLRCRQVGRFKIERSKRCIHCGICAGACPFKVHRRRKEKPQLMAEPRSELCKGCFSCIFNCPANALTISKNPEFYELGNSIYTPDIISTIWYEATTGKIPVSGAGYRGPFSGSGFDSMWTDMSEIVRPTRDGIHGREYISTSIDIGRKPTYLDFKGYLELPPIAEIQIPVIFDTLPLNLDIRVIAAKAAFELGTLAIMELPESMFGYSSAVVPFSKTNSLTLDSGIVEIEYRGDIAALLKRIKQNSNLIISVRLPTFNSWDIQQIVQQIVEAGCDVIHLQADRKNIKDCIISMHRYLVDLGIRDQVTLIASGDIALAEHVAKAIICGADAVAIDMPLLIALGCRVCSKCESTTCEAKLNKQSLDFAVQRIKNLMAAWRDQLLEVLGAMGLRDVRRLRGETGRAMFFEELEKELLQICVGREVKEGA